MLDSSLRAPRLFNRGISLDSISMVCIGHECRISLDCRPSWNRIGSLSLPCSILVSTPIIFLACCNTASWSYFSRSHAHARGKGVPTDSFFLWFLKHDDAKKQLHERQQIPSAGAGPADRWSGNSRRGLIAIEQIWLEIYLFSDRRHTWGNFRTFDLELSSAPQAPRAADSCSSHLWKIAVNFRCHHDEFSMWDSLIRLLWAFLGRAECLRISPIVDSFVLPITLFAESRQR
jgi:hypothetical protein